MNVSLISLVSCDSSIYFRLLRELTASYSESKTVMKLYCSHLLLSSPSF